MITVADQEVRFRPALTLLDFVFGAMGSLAPLRKTISELEGRLSDSRCADEYAIAINEYQERGGYAAEATVARILSGSGYSEEDFDRDIQTLSGGERTRAGLAQALSMESDVLILERTYQPSRHQCARMAGPPPAISADRHRTHVPRPHAARWIRHTRCRD